MIPLLFLITDGRTNHGSVFFDEPIKDALFISKKIPRGIEFLWGFLKAYAACSFTFLSTTNLLVFDVGYSHRCIL